MRTLLALSFVLAFALPGISAADQAVRFNQVEVHYNAVATDFLSPQVAKSYGITRSHYRGLLTISVLADQAKGAPQAVAAKVSAYRVNMADQLANIDMREVKEAHAIYYLGTFHISRPETLTFHVNVTPHGKTQAYQVKFTRDFD
ncbi:MAG: DUF4426 domain-containing protein [Betaproteobacteria bacterium]|nr:DUF4426 domain-containing protein [Betaproteobacteria bacterium]